MYTLAEIIERLSKSMQDHEALVTAKSEFANLSVTQIHYLDAIRHLDKPAISELAEHQQVTKPTATVTLEKLERAGYITKVPSLDDHRVSHVNLTEKGLRIADLHDEIHQGYADFFIEALDSDEIDTIVLLLNKVVSHLRL
jgi:DNA-binding MarR family transcriptional regulator